MAPILPNLTFVLENRKIHLSKGKPEADMLKMFTRNFKDIAYNM